MEEQVICAGFGGQGIMFIGKLLAQVLMVAGNDVTWMPSYGAEVRGGTAHCMVIVSDKKIASPLVSEPRTCIVMNTPSFNKYEPKVKKKGKLFVNVSLIDKRSERDDIEIIEVPATEVANSLGNVRVANMVMLGAYIANSKIINKTRIIEGLRPFLGSKKEDLFKINCAAFKKGVELTHA